MIFNGYYHHLISIAVIITIYITIINIFTIIIAMFIIIATFINVIIAKVTQNTDQISQRPIASGWRCHVFGQVMFTPERGAGATPLGHMEHTHLFPALPKPS